MGRRRFEKIKERRQKIAKERISILLDLAEERALSKDMEHASRYASQARKIGMRYNVNMPKGFKLTFCRKCNTYLLPSRTSRYRLTHKKLTRQCIKCGTYYRMPTRERGK
jgi:ribonuclease P protein subunit RPR2